MTIFLSSIVNPTPASAVKASEGVWLVDSSSALQVFDCDGLLCGRVAWLKHVRDPDGQIQRDRKNPDPALRERPICGLTVLWGLGSTDTDSSKPGWFYNPDDGRTYSVTAKLRARDTMIVRIYLGVPLFGQTKALRRIQQPNSERMC
jgi:uncharacterized protein (DUF2147 family)